MAIKKFKPTSHSRRQMAVVSSDDLTKGFEPAKSLTERKKSKVGRNNQGRQLNPGFYLGRLQVKSSTGLQASKSVKIAIVR